MSPVTLAEVLVGPTRAGLLDPALAAIRALDIQQIALAPDAPVRRARMRATTRVKLPDCWVMLAAETTGADIATFDDRLTKAATNHGIVVVRS